MKAETETLAECMPHVQKLASGLEIIFRNDCYILPNGSYIMQDGAIILVFQTGKKRI